jgi:hypothetical protein
MYFDLYLYLKSIIIAPELKNPISLPMKGKEIHLWGILKRYFLLK